MHTEYMPFETWEPVYELILSDFGYDREADERARDLLAEFLDSDKVRSVTDMCFEGTVAVCGAGPSLAGELGLARTADHVVAASTAVDVLRDAGVGVDCMVTDLDKNPDTARDLAAAGTTVAVHAHGDNTLAIRETVPTFEQSAVLPTTQARPRAPVENHGGFTDGDRAAFLAHAAGADRLRFPGWDFDDSTVGRSKARKLQWAERLLRWLEIRREERFGVLDGRRDRIDLPWVS